MKADFNYNFFFFFARSENKNFCVCEVGGFYNRQVRRERPYPSRFFFLI